MLILNVYLLKLWYHKLRKAFSKFYRRHHELVSKFSVRLKTLLHQCLSEPEFYGDIVYKLKCKRTGFSDRFRKVIIRHKRTDYNLNIIRQSACLVINPITVDYFAALLNYTPVDRGQTLCWSDLKLCILVGLDRSSIVCYLVHRGANDDLFLLQISSGVVLQSRDFQLSRKTYLLCHRLYFFNSIKQ